MGVTRIANLYFSMPNRFPALLGPDSIRPQKEIQHTRPSVGPCIHAQCTRELPITLIQAPPSVRLSWGPRIRSSTPFLDGRQSGISRFTSGLPFSFLCPVWTTDWEQESCGVATCPSQVKSCTVNARNGQVTYFSNAAGIDAGVATDSPVQLPYPREAVQPNKFNGDGHLDLDSSLSNSSSFERSRTLQFAWGGLQRDEHGALHSTCGVGVCAGASVSREAERVARY